jgi:hypothetical protein
MRKLLQEVLDYLERREAESPHNICSACGHARELHVKDSADHDVCVQGLDTDHGCSCLEFRWEATYIAASEGEKVNGAESERFLLAGKVRDGILALDQTVGTGSSSNVVCDVAVQP